MGAQQSWVTLAKPGQAWDILLVRCKRLAVIMAGLRSGRQWRRWLRLVAKGNQLDVQRPDRGWDGLEYTFSLVPVLYSSCSLSVYPSALT